MGAPAAVCLARDCAANCDNVFALPQRALGDFCGALGCDHVRRLDAALRIALDPD